MPPRLTVARLAAEAEADIEDTLVTLWDAGIDDPEDPDDVIPAVLVKRARAALGIESAKQQKHVSYWIARTGFSQTQLSEILGELGVKLSPQARVLPKGALPKLRRRFDNRLPAANIAPAPNSGPTSSSPDQFPPCPELKWADVGHRRSVICHLSEQQVLGIHDALVADFAAADDPISPPGLRSEHLLSSALSRPHTGLGDSLKYPTIELAGAALLHSLTMNHAFHNGNKRTALVAMIVFLDANGLVPTCNETALFRIVLRVAQHGLVPLYCSELADREVLEIAKWIRANSRLIEKGERAIPWLKLRRILRGFGCESAVSPNVGNRMNLTRALVRRGRFGRTRVETLSIQVSYGDDGRTVARNTLNSIREALELDEEHGVDSKSFYEAESLPDDFIQQYRTLLRRLARV